MTSSGDTGALTDSADEVGIGPVDGTEPVPLEEVPGLPEPDDEWDGDAQDEQDVLEGTDIVDQAELTTQSINGFSVCDKKTLATFKVPGANVELPVRREIAPLLIGLAAEFHRRVEPLRTPGCWGYACRKVRGSNSPSFHSAGIAIDLNAPKHPLGKRGTFTAQQAATCRALAREYGCRWGGDYRNRADEMHFEVILSRPQALVLARLKQQPPAQRGVACAVSGWLFAQRGPSLFVYRPTKLPVGGPFAGKAREVSKGWGAISRIFSGGNGVLYAIDTAGKLRWYRWNGTTFAKGAGTEIGSGWGGFTHVFSGGDGVVYAVTKDGKLLWYRHANPLGAVKKWVVGSGKTISTGWGGFTHLFPGGQGVIYAVNKAGELRWYRNANPLTGVGWVKGSGKKIGTGWNTLTCTSAGGGVIYAINKAGELRWYRNANPFTGAGWVKGSGKKIGTGWTGMTPTADLTTCTYKP